jgi:hypothetical protein
MHQESDATTARRWDIMPLNVLIEMKKERGNTMHMQQIQKSSHPRRRKRMKNLYLFQLSQALSLKEFVFVSTLICTIIITQG